MTLKSSCSSENLKKVLESIDDFTAGYLVLRGDFFFHKVSDNLGTLVDTAANVGRENATKIAEETKTNNPLEIAAQFGLEVITVYQENVMGGLSIRSEYMPPRRIKIYEKSIEQLKKAIIDMRLEEFFPIESIGNLHVAHEIFHYLEKTRIGILGEKHNIYGLRLGPLRFKIRISALSEIAAHTFAKTLTGVKVSPSLLDYIVKSDLYELLVRVSEVKVRR